MSKKKKKVEKKQIQFNYKITEFAWLSNFLPCCIEMKDEDGKRHLFASAEHAFQFFKTDNQLHREKILNAVGASKARYWGSEKSGCPIRSDWEEVKSSIMTKVLTAKFKQNSVLKKRLLATGSDELVELAPWDKEGYWGVNNSGEGNNKTGKILMKVRSKLT